MSIDFLFYCTGVAFWIVLSGCIFLPLWWWLSISIAFTYAYSANDWIAVDAEWKKKPFWRSRVALEMAKPSNAFDALGSTITTGFFKIDCTGDIPRVTIFNIAEDTTNG